MATTEVVRQGIPFFGGVVTYTFFWRKPFLSDGAALTLSRRGKKKSVFCVVAARFSRQSVPTLRGPLWEFSTPRLMMGFIAQFFIFLSSFRSKSQFLFLGEVFRAPKIEEKKLGKKNGAHTLASIVWRHLVTSVVGPNCSTDQDQGCGGRTPPFSSSDPFSTAFLRA